MLAIFRLYPDAYVKYEFINRGDTSFPEGFAEQLKEEIARMTSLAMTKQEKAFITERCYFFDPAFIDFLEGYRYNPDEVQVLQAGDRIKIEIEGYWFRTVLWEVPLMAIISELYFKMMGVEPQDIRVRATEKAKALAGMKADYSDFGTRRRFSYDVHDQVVGCLKEHSGPYFKGTSNVYLAMNIIQHR